VQLIKQIDSLLARLVAAKAMGASAETITAEATPTSGKRQYIWLAGAIIIIGFFWWLLAAKRRRKKDTGTQA
jgi:hypothetical protein